MNNLQKNIKEKLLAFKDNYKKEKLLFKLINNNYKIKMKFKIIQIQNKINNLFFKLGIKIVKSKYYIISLISLNKETMTVLIFKRCNNKL